MIRSDAIEIVNYPILSRFNEITHFTTTRFGGVSSGNYKSLNLGLYSGDEVSRIDTNFKRLCAEIQLDRTQIYLPFQTHEDRILCVSNDFLIRKNNIQSENLYGIDALITNIPEVCIGVTTADCVPILIYDSENKAVGAVHAGWRGTHNRIAEKTIAAMVQNFGSNPKNLLVAVGASISPDAYQVGDELIGVFEKENFDTDKVFFRKNGKYHLDLWTANKLILENIGIPSQNIEISGICTFTEHEKYFSARRLGINSGRLIHCIMIKKDTSKLLKN